MTTRIRLPHQFTPRHYQRPLFAAFDRGIRRFLCCWHRRTGKDKAFFNLMVREAASGRVGNYYYVFPTYSQGKKALWEAVDRDGFRVRDHCPPALLTGKPNETDMQLRFRSGSTIQVIGSDKVDSLVGTNPIGLVFSEYSLQSPAVWQFLQPILIENGGWAGFNFTPRGANHARDLYEYARRDPAWFASLLTVDDTGVLTPAQLAQATAEMSPEMVAQEFYCDFDAGNVGAYYARQLADSRRDGRIGRVPHDPALRVHTVWDVGVSDHTAIGLVQVRGSAIYAIDYYANHSEGFDHYRDWLERRAAERGYRYGVHIGPHDIGQRSKNDGKSYAAYARERGFTFKVLPVASFEAGVEATRVVLPRVFFDETHCDLWIKALRAYTKKFNEALQVWSSAPLHDWASHPADMTRYLAEADKAGLLADHRPSRFAAPSQELPGIMGGSAR